MKTFEKIAAQGEIKIIRLSDDAEMMGDPLAPEADGLVIGHSETGHHHVIDREAARAFVAPVAPEGMRIMRLIVEKPTELRHLRSHDTHAPIGLSPGKYEVRIGREFDPYADLARRVAD